MKIEFEQIEEYQASSKILREKAEKIVYDGGVGLIAEIKDDTYKTVVIENNDEYLIEINVGDIENTTCNCSTNKNYKRCQHVLAFLIDLKKYLDSNKRNFSPSEIATKNFIDYFNYTPRYCEIVNLRPKLLISEQSKVFKMSLVIKFEGKREFKVNNIVSVIETLCNNRNLEIVKQMELVSGEYKLSAQTKKIIDILKLNEEYINAVANSQLIADITLSKLEMISILEVLTDQLVDINFKEGRLKLPPINQILTIKNRNGIIQIGSKANHKMSEIISERLIKSYDNYYLLTEKESEIYNLVRPLFSVVNSIELPNRFFEKFMMNTKNSLASLFQIENDKEFDAPLLDFPLNVQVKIDQITNAKLGIEVSFIYGETVFGFDGYSAVEKFQLINRNVELESQILQLLNISQYDHVPTTTNLGYLVTKSHRQSFDLLVNILPKIQEHATVLVSPEVEGKLYKINNKSFAVSLNADKHLDFFEFNYQLDEFSPEEIGEMLRAYELGENYYVFNDTKYVSFAEESVKNQLKFLSQVSSDFAQFNQQIPFYRYITLKQMSDSLFTDVHYDEILEEKLKQINQITVDTTTLKDVTVRDYQQKGMTWLAQLDYFKLGGILADEMGLGKTLQVIGYLLNCKDKRGLIVVPKALLYNWAQELKRYAPQLDFTIINGNKSERLNLYENSNCNIFITSYNMLRLDIDMYQEKFDICIIDEAQTIKNPTVQVTKAIKKINADIKFALTGTPIENNLVDLWSIVDFINPNYLKSQAEFKHKFLGDENNIDLLKFHLSPILLRRKKQDVLKELPDKIETPVFCELTPKQKVVYANYVDKYRDKLFGFIENDIVGQSQIEILSLLTRLRQIACHPRLFIDNYESDSGKVELLLELIAENVDNDNKMLVFSQFTSFLKIVAHELTELGVEYYYLDGSTSAEERIRLVEKFNNDQTKVFLISLKAGGVGLNLTSASTVIHLDPWWNPQVESQATDRAHRIGQKKVVQVNKLITKGTIEEKIYLLQQEKKQLTDDILNLDSKMLTNLSKTEIIKLFTMD